MITQVLTLVTTLATKLGTSRHPFGESILEVSVICPPPPEIDSMKKGVIELQLIGEKTKSIKLIDLLLIYN